MSLWYKQLATDQKTVEKALKEYFPEVVKEDEGTKKKVAKKKTAKKKVASSDTEK